MDVIFSAVAISTTSNTTVHGPTTAAKNSLLVNLCNRGGATAKVRLAISAAATPSDGEWIEYDYPLDPAGLRGSTLERGGLAVPAGKYVVVRSDVGTVSAQVSGVAL